MTLDRAQMHTEMTKQVLAGRGMQGNTRNVYMLTSQTCF